MPENVWTREKLERIKEGGGALPQRQMADTSATAASGREEKSSGALGQRTPAPPEPAPTTPKKD